MENLNTMVLVIRYKNLIFETQTAHWHLQVILPYGLQNSSFGRKKRNAFISCVTDNQISLGIKRYSAGILQGGAVENFFNTFSIFLKKKYFVIKSVSDNNSTRLINTQSIWTIKKVLSKRPEQLAFFTKHYNSVVIFITHNEFTRVSDSHTPRILEFGILSCSTFSNSPQRRERSFLDIDWWKFLNVLSIYLNCQYMFSWLIWNERDCVAAILFVSYFHFVSDAVQTKILC